MNAVIKIRSEERLLSTQMSAVLTIFEADNYLMNSVLPFINFDTETILWEPISKIPFGSGHKGACAWAYSIWTDELKPRANPFDSALSMSPKLQVAILKALSMRWRLDERP